MHESHGVPERRITSPSGIKARSVVFLPMMEQLVARMQADVEGHVSTVQLQDIGITLIALVLLAEEAIELQPAVVVMVVARPVVDLVASREVKALPLSLGLQTPALPSWKSDEKSTWEISLRVRAFGHRAVMKSPYHSLSGLHHSALCEVVDPAPHTVLFCGHACVAWTVSKGGGQSTFPHGLGSLNWAARTEIFPRLQTGAPFLTRHIDLVGVQTGEVGISTVPARLSLFSIGWGGSVVHVSGAAGFVPADGLQSCSVEGVKYA